MTNPVGKVFGVFVRNYRIKHDLSQEEFAKRVDLSRASIAMIEAGHQCPSGENLFRISHYCEFSLDEMMAMLKNTNLRTASEEGRIERAKKTIERNKEILRKLGEYE